MILVDTSGLLSALDESQRIHAQCAATLEQVAPPLLLSPFVLAELDYLLMRHIGRGAQTAFLQEVAQGAYQLEPFGATDVARASEIMETYADLDVGLADASIVVLGERHGLKDVLTLDERHFRAMRVGGKRFKVLPFDRDARS